MGNQWRNFFHCISLCGYEHYDCMCVCAPHACPLFREANIRHQAPEMNLHMVMTVPKVLGIELVSSGRAINDPSSLHPPGIILLMPFLLPD